MHSNLLAFIDATDDLGILRFSVDQWLAGELPKGADAAMREVFRGHFQDAGFIRLRMNRGGSWPADFEAKAVRDANGDWHCQVNLARAMLLPGVNAKTELQAMRALLQAAKELFAATPEQRLDLQFVNERARQGRVFGDVACRRPDPDSPGRMKADEAESQRFRTLIKDLGLTDWTRALALELGKMGPHSWWCLTETHVFDENQCPHREHVLKGILAKRMAATVSSDAASAASDVPESTQPATKSRMKP